MKEVFGWILAAILIVFFVGTLIYCYGLKRTIWILAISFGLAGLIILSIYLIIE